MKFYFILFMAIIGMSAFGVAENNEVLPNLNKTNKVDKIKVSQNLNSFSEPKEITDEFGGADSVPPPPAPGELMDGIPVPGIPEGAELNIEPQDPPVVEKEKATERSIFDRDSNLSPSFTIDPIQEIKEAPITKESERDEKNWKEREKTEEME